MWCLYFVYVSRFFLQPRACTHALSDKISAPTTESKAQTKNCTHQDKIRIVEPDPPCKDWYGHGQWSYSINITQGNVVLVSHIILAPFGNCAPCLHSQRAFFNTSIFFHSMLAGSPLLNGKQTKHKPFHNWILFLQGRRHWGKSSIVKARVCTKYIFDQ